MANILTSRNKTQQNYFAFGQFDMSVFKYTSYSLVRVSSDSELVEIETFNSDFENSWDGIELRF